jgi:DNA-binding response OmpR family regulator
MDQAVTLEPPGILTVSEQSPDVPRILDRSEVSTVRRVSTDTVAARGLILVVEDESAIADLIRMYLSRAGYGVQIERDGVAGLAAVRNLEPAAVILDIGLPRMDGIEVCRTMRAERNWTPVLFLSARDDEIDRVLGLELGADDYITKPFSPRELVARVAGVLRRVNGPPDQHERPLEIGSVRVDAAAHRVFVDGAEVSLTATEFDLLVFLMRRPGRVISREQLLSEVWGYSALGGGRTVDVHIAQVRAKLGPASPIRTVRRVGYSVEPSRG